ncbi:MAG: twin-arginine translocation signal domain-containing protein, partial [Bacteroidia bacterium]
MGSRRTFIRTSAIASALALTGLPKLAKAVSNSPVFSGAASRKPLVLS